MVHVLRPEAGRIFARVRVPGVAGSEAVGRRVEDCERHRRVRVRVADFLAGGSLAIVPCDRVDLDAATIADVAGTLVPVLVPVLVVPIAGLVTAAAPAPAAVAEMEPIFLPVAAVVQSARVAGSPVAGHQVGLVAAR